MQSLLAGSKIIVDGVLYSNSNRNIDKFVVVL